MSRPAPEFPQLMTAAEVAPILRLSPYGVIALCRSKKLRATKPGLTWLIEAESVHEYLASGVKPDEAAS